MKEEKKETANKSPEKILYCVLNWGLGHATRSIPVIKKQLKKGHTVHIASDGLALIFLKKKFPNLEFHELPAYDIQYGATDKSMWWTLFKQLPKIQRSIRLEKKIIDELVDIHHFERIISDNRLGCYHPEIENIYLTHQLKIPEGLQGKIATYFHRKAIRKFSEIWVPDDKQHTLSGILSKWKGLKKPIKFLGPLSHLKKAQPSENPEIRYLLLLSGPEPQRTLLEEKLIDCLRNITEKIVLVRGTNRLLGKTLSSNWEVHDMILGDPLQKLICNSAYIVSRSGYSSIMDFAQFGIRPILIPTPGQPEQKYLALRLRRKYRTKILRQKYLEKFNWSNPYVPKFQPIFASHDTRNRVQRKASSKAPSGD